MKKIITSTLYISTFLLLTIGCSGKEPAAETIQINPGKFDSLLIKKVVATNNDTSKMAFVDVHQLKTERWDQLAQPAFWKKIICLSPDSCIVNIAETRTPIEQVPYTDWKTIVEPELSREKDKVRNKHNIANDKEIYITSGKRHFFEHRKTIPYLSKAVQYFIDNDVDPFYAQAILLIESPGKSKSISYAGAGGPFQLMPYEAQKYGLVVNSNRDDRSDLKKSAYASSMSLKNSFIPSVRKILNERNIKYNETDTWFRLLVMHAYHAGPGNLRCAINKINPTTGGQELIVKLWTTEACGFKNESQNYSQIALASLLNFDDLMNSDGDSVFIVYGARYESKVNRKQLKNISESDQIVTCIEKYERDMIDGTIDFTTYQNKTTVLKNRLAKINTTYPLKESHYISLASELMIKRMNEEAATLLQINLLEFPNSKATTDSLSKAYKNLGKLELSQKYANQNTQEN